MFGNKSSAVSSLKSVVKAVLLKLGWQLVPVGPRGPYPDMEDCFKEIHGKCKPYTMTSMG